jgi:hypothetical protein
MWQLKVHCQSETRPANYDCCADQHRTKKSGGFKKNLQGNKSYRRTRQPGMRRCLLGGITGEGAGDFFRKAGPGSGMCRDSLQSLWRDGGTIAFSSKVAKPTVPQKYSPLALVQKLKGVEHLDRVAIRKHNFADCQRGHGVGIPFRRHQRPRGRPPEHASAVGSVSGPRIKMDTIQPEGAGRKAPISFPRDIIVTLWNHWDQAEKPTFPSFFKSPPGQAMPFGTNLPSFPSM